MALTAAQLKAAVNGLEDDTEAARLLAVASAAVDVEAHEDTPEAIVDEATIRTAAWLFQSQTNVGRQTMETRTSAASAVRASGARALLAPHREAFL